MPRRFFGSLDDLPHGAGLRFASACKLEVMSRVRTRISVTGFTEAEVREGLPDLLEEFRQRPWLGRTDASWDARRSRLVITVEAEGSNPATDGGDSGANLDDVWDSVIACINFTSAGIHFEVEASEVIRSPTESMPG
jgi:hypothetical protein